MENAIATSIEAGDADTALVRAMARHEQDALRELYASYGRRLFAYALRLTGSQGLAEEVLQDSLLAAWRGAGGYRGEGRVSTWLLGIVHRQAGASRRRKHLPTTELDVAEGVLGGAAEPESEALAKDRQTLLRRAMTELSPEHRQTLHLVFYQGLSLTEVAEVCGCPLGTVKSRLNHAKARLRGVLSQAGLGAEDLL
jgi:RNA polymerase sigma factor (sigma-70 family)